jgi:23S rRNA (uridine2479-2'-O)-methyltransferase
MATRTLPVESENQWFQLVQTLKGNRQKRWHERLFFVEGVRSINQLRGNPRWQVEAILYGADRRLSGWARDILAEVPASFHLVVKSDLMEKISDREEGSEIIAIVKIPATNLADLAADATSRFLLLDRPGNPGNLGSIIRSCDAFGVTGVVIAGHAVDPYDPLVIRASEGAFFTQSVVRVEKQETLDAWLTRLGHDVPGITIVGTSAKADAHVADCNLAGPLVLCFGNETLGLSRWLKSRCAILAGIPMSGVASSLNLACAVTTVLYEMHRQTRAV